MNRVLHSDAQLSITIDDEAGVVRYVRTREPYPSLEVVRDLHEKIRAVITKLPRGKLSLLVDVRDAPARNDDRFEAEIARAIEAVAIWFTARAALVKSAVGRLQVQRIAKDRGSKNFSTFSSEEEALEYLRTVKAAAENG